MAEASPTWPGQNEEWVLKARSFGTDSQMFLRVGKGSWATWSTPAPGRVSSDVRGQRDCLGLEFKDT